ncbi:hypothetical protein Slin14017_G034540 [Septoria linicola]|nr:hypothetical protein Slin14017_G034540 [Septoria linicola]
MKALLVMTLLWCPLSAVAYSRGYDTTRNPSRTSLNSSIEKRGNEGNDADRDWWPFMGVEMQLSDDKIEQLPYAEVQKMKLRAASKGLRLLCRMKSPVSNPPTSNDFKPRSGRDAVATLAKHGWESWANHAVTDLDSYGLNAAFGDLGISRTPKYWTKSTALHGVDTSDALRDYPATYASYDSMFNLRDGVLVAVANCGPEAQIQKPEFSHISKDEVVPLRRWSDVVWLHREKVMRDLRQTRSASPLEHIFRHNIVTSETDALFRLITGRRTPAEWPGVSYPIEEPQALAALSSPHGSGPAWLLIQHKEGGSRMIDRINIFSCARSAPGARGNWCLYLHVTDSR